MHQMHVCHMSFVKLHLKRKEVYMARKHHPKHSKTTILASSSARHPFSKLSVSAASAVVGASLALSVTPALAQGVTSKQPQTQETAKTNTPKLGDQNQAKGANSSEKAKKIQAGGGYSEVRR